MVGAYFISKMEFCSWVGNTVKLKFWYPLKKPLEWDLSVEFWTEEMMVSPKKHWYICIKLLPTIWQFWILHAAKFIVPFQVFTVHLKRKGKFNWHPPGLIWNHTASFLFSKIILTLLFLSANNIGLKDRVTKVPLFYYYFFNKKGKRKK